MAAVLLQAGPGAEALLLFVRVSLLLGGALLLGRLLRTAAPMERHRFWTGALAAALCLPLLPRVLPAVPLPAVQLPAVQLSAVQPPAVQPPAAQLPAPLLPALNPAVAQELAVGFSPAPHSGVRPSDAVSPWIPSSPRGASGALPSARTPVPVVEPALPLPGPSPLSWGHLLLALWGAGMAVSLGGLVRGIRRTSALAREGTPLEAVRGDLPVLPLLRRAGVPAPHRVRVVVTAGIRVPGAAGVVRPTILLPLDATAWSVSRLEAVLLHEGIHLARRDPARWVLTRIVLALYWFHPLAWRVAGRAAEAREEACDARVVALGPRASAYAGHLLALATPAPARGHPLATLPGFAHHHPSLERRIMAVLSPPTGPLHRSRGIAPTAMALGGIGVLLLAACAPAGVRGGTEYPEGTSPAPFEVEHSGQDPEAEPGPEPLMALPSIPAPDTPADSTRGVAVVEAEEERGRAAQARAQAAHERTQAGHERAEAARERAQAASERAQAAHERAQAAHERAQATHDRAEAARERAHAAHEEARALHGRLWAEHERLWADHERLWAEHERLRADHERHWSRHEGTLPMPTTLRGFVIPGGEEAGEEPGLSPEGASFLLGRVGGTP